MIGEIHKEVAETLVDNTRVKHSIQFIPGQSHLLLSQVIQRAVKEGTLLTTEELKRILLLEYVDKSGDADKEFNKTKVTSEFGDISDECVNQLLDEIQNIKETLQSSDNSHAAEFEARMTRQQKITRLLQGL